MVKNSILQEPPEAGACPADVRRLVVAARNVAYQEHPSADALGELDKAAEAFAARVPWDDEPDDK